MKTLNRPMFRYGGPIKEGVMNGIREPKKNGGSMSPNEGPRRAALVGDPNFPQTNGRAHHVAPIVYGAGMGLARAAPLALRYGRQGVGLAKRGIGAIKGLFGKNKPFQGPVGSSTTSKGTFTPAGVNVPFEVVEEPTGPWNGLFLPNRPLIAPIPLLARPTPCLPYLKARGAALARPIPAPYTIGATWCALPLV